MYISVTICCTDIHIKNRQNKQIIMGFWKDVSYEMSLGKSKEIAIKDTVDYYKKYKPSYFKRNEEKKTNNLL